MEYTTQIADNPDEAHVNYQCPCGCTAGLMYKRQSGSLHVGACCCGRLLWLGPDGETVVTSRYESGTDYTLDINDVTLPWGETTTAFLAVPSRSLKDVATPQEHHDAHGHEHEADGHSHDQGHVHAAHRQYDHDGHDHDHDHDHDHGHLHVDRAAIRVRDLVCGMMIEPTSAAATSVYKGETYYFCSLGCKQQFDADPTRYVKSKGLLARIFGRS